jgi:hypothetical protein
MEILESTGNFPSGVAKLATVLRLNGAVWKKEGKDVSC